jgi:hypothetical protein
VGLTAPPYTYRKALRLPLYAGRFLARTSTSMIVRIFECRPAVSIYLDAGCVSWCYTSDVIENDCLGCLRAAEIVSLVSRSPQRGFADPGEVVALLDDGSTLVFDSIFPDRLAAAISSTLRLTFEARGSYLMRHGSLVFHAAVFAMLIAIVLSVPISVMWKPYVVVLFTPITFAAARVFGLLSPKRSNPVKLMT